MAQEIERKWLIDPKAPRAATILSLVAGVELEQGYLRSDAGGVVRVRIAGPEAFLTVKTPTIGLSRQEFEYPVPLEDAKIMLESMCATRLAKTRQVIPHGDLKIEVDTFRDLPLTLAEVEFPDEAAARAFTAPDWFGKEVSEDPAYFNNAIAARLASA